MYTRQENLSWLLMPNVLAPPLTLRCDGDCRYAAARGLADYLLQISYEEPGGRDLRLQSVEPEFGDSETPMKIPGAGILLGGSGGEYEPLDTAGFDEQPIEAVVDRHGNPVPEGRAFFARRPTHFHGELTVELWAESKLGCRNLVKMCEDDFNPGEDVGFRLVLPHYYNTRCVYGTRMHVRYEEDGGNAKARRYKAFFSVAFELDQVVIRSIAIAKTPQFRTEVSTSAEELRLL